MTGLFLRYCIIAHSEARYCLTDFRGCCLENTCDVYFWQDLTFQLQLRYLLAIGVSSTSTSCHCLLTSSYIKMLIQAYKLRKILTPCFKRSLTKHGVGENSLIEKYCSHKLKPYIRMYYITSLHVYLRTLPAVYHWNDRTINPFQSIADCMVIVFT